jgi:hypothetical protein
MNAFKAFWLWSCDILIQGVHDLLISFKLQREQVEVLHNEIYVESNQHSAQPRTQGLLDCWMVDLFPVTHLALNAGYFPSFVHWAMHCGTYSHEPLRPTVWPANACQSAGLWKCRALQAQLVHYFMYVTLFWSFYSGDVWSGATNY